MAEKPVMAFGCSSSRPSSPGNGSGNNFFAATGFFSPGDFLSSLASSAAISASSSASPFFSACSASSQAAASQMLARNSTKTLKCPKCNWHYKYQETLEIHMKEKHANQEVVCVFCVENQAHPKLARGETYSCGYKPYRCELCKYSTTTKGNLSIHMQSDKHLHALQDIPQSLAGDASQLFLGQHSAAFQQMESGIGGGFASHTNRTLQCLVCLSFCTDSLEDMAAHLDRDRGQPQDGDMVALHGFFQCLLCPYSTNLKANFQLHTRTDKHLQRVQLINHLREGSALLGPAEQFARLGSLKSAVQVRCQPCQELFNCGSSLREHCHSRAHLQRLMMASSDVNVFSASSASSAVDCPLPAASGSGPAGVPVETTIEELLRNGLVRCGSCSWEEGSANLLMADAANEHAILHSGGSSDGVAEKEKGDNQAPNDRQTAVIGWQELDNHLLSAGLACHRKKMAEPAAEADGQKQTEEEQRPAAATAAAKCPFCSADPVPELCQHIAQAHNIPAEIAQRLAQQIVDHRDISGSSSEEEPLRPVKSEPSCSTAMAQLPEAGTSSRTPDFAIFRHNCAHCSMAFQSADQLRVHSLRHSNARFRLLRRCQHANCGELEPMATRAALEQHMAEKHCMSPADGDGQKRMTAAEGGSGHFCDICQDGRRFDSDQELMAHFNSEAHLQRLANNGVQPSPLLEESAGTSGNHAAPLPGSKRRSNSAKSLPYICNVCALAFGQPGTLDTHLRSMAHAQRMGKLPELIQSGELDPKKAIFEQPEPHPPQRSIGEMAKEKNKKQQMGKMDTTTAQASMQSSSANNQLELLKADQQQQQQQMLHHLMMQMFGGAAPQPTEAVRNQQQTFSAAAQMAQMLLTAQMAAAQMASASTNGFSGFGMLDMLASRPNSKAALPQKEELNNNSTVTELDEPKAKRPRADNQQQKQHSSQQRWPSNGTAREESSPVSREGSIAPSAMPSASAGLDLASVLQALAAGANPSTMSSAFPFCPTPSATDPNVDFLMAMSAFPACTSAPPLTTATTTAQQQQQQANNPTSPSPQKRARTRIGDEQIKILRQYFDINNSPSEEHIKEMAQRTQLGEKVIKHWFRNTLFKERQRDKDSPYNFSIPPQMSIDLATYHRTGEARIMPLVKQEENKEDEEEERRNETDNINKNGDQQKLEEQKLKQKAEEITVRKEDQTTSAEIETGLLNGCEEAEGRGGMSALAVMKKENDERQKHDEEEEEEEKAIPREKEKRSEGNREEEQRKISASSSSTSSPTEQEEEEAQQQRTTAESVAAVAANLLASIGQQQLQSAASGSLPPLNPFGFGPAEQFAQMFSSALPSFNSSPSPFGSFCGFAGGSPSLFNPFVPIQQSNSQSAPIASQQPQQQQPTISSSNSSAQSQPPYSSSGQQQQQHQASSSSMGSGRRANRTRFTDFQLRTLQEFFDKQAYPKDDDLEMLSKKMGLSPRVIVVWFQNARQKARKVFEQQPHLLVQQASEVQTDPRFVRTPSANFQCRCGQVFQRYQELIQHKQKVCLVAEHEKATEMAQNSADSSSLNDAFSAAVNGGRLEDEEGAGGKSALESAQEMLLRQLMMVPLQQQTGQHLEQIKPEASTHQHQQHPERPFHKRCPYCGRLFHSRDKLATHLPLRHPEQPCLLADLDLLPDADEVPGADQIGRSTASSAEPPGPLDLSLNGSRFFNGGGASSEEAREENACWRSNEASLSPAAFSSAGENEPSDLLLAQSCSPLAALLPALFQPMAANQQRPPAQPSPQHSTNSSSKRFRTHLTPIQVFVMKSLFHDYKTPSMQECDCLGQRIGLHKRVVQVWFQNARAKERKAASGNGSAEPEEFIPCCGSTQHCQLCDLPLISGQPLQEHIFGREHIEKVRERGAQLKGVEVDSVEGSKEPQGGHSTTPTPTAQQQDQQQQQAHQMMAQLGPLAQLPYYALAAAATGLGQPGLSPLLYDPAIFGTPVPALKVPEAVAQQILADMAQRKENSKFTQDGMELADLERKLAANDFRMASTVDLEVGWGCPQCGNMFQQLELLQNHQKLICAGVDGTFGLVQTHYQCDCCQQRFGTQEDFCSHCHSEEHKQATKAAKRRGSCALAATEPVPPAGS